VIQILIALLSLLDIGIILNLLYLIGFHCYLIIKGITTYEYIFGADCNTNKKTAKDEKKLSEIHPQPFDNVPSALLIQHSSEAHSSNEEERVPGERKLPINSSKNINRMILGSEKQNKVTDNNLISHNQLGDMSLRKQETVGIREFRSFKKRITESSEMKEFESDYLENELDNEACLHKKDHSEHTANNTERGSEMTK